MITTDTGRASVEAKELIEDISGKLRELAREFAQAVDCLEVLEAAPKESCPSLGVKVEGFRYILTRLPARCTQELTPREQKVAVLAAQGLSFKAIATYLGTAKSTVAVHLKHVFTKLGVHSRWELAWQVLANGIMQFEEVNYGSHGDWTLHEVGGGNDPREDVQ